MKDHDKALETYQEGLKHEPNSEELKEGVRRCMEHINKVDSICKRCGLQVALTPSLLSQLPACQQPAQRVCIPIAKFTDCSACCNACLPVVIALCRRRLNFVPKPRISSHYFGSRFLSSPCLSAFAACRNGCPLLEFIPTSYHCHGLLKIIHRALLPVERKNARHEGLPPTHECHPQPVVACAVRCIPQAHLATYYELWHKVHSLSCRSWQVGKPPRGSLSR